MNTTASLTQQFRAEYAQGVVPAMLKAIKAAQRDTRLIVLAVLAITYHHQAHWLTTIEGIGILGWVIPAVVDISMLRMLGIVQTAGMKRPAKTGALKMFAALAVMSAAVNIAAPGAVAARAIFGALVLIAAGVKVVASLVGPDFDEMEQSETAAQVAPAAPEVDEEAVERRRAAALKGAETRRQRKADAEKLAEEKRVARRVAAAAKRLEAIAPSSPSHPVVVLSAADKEALAHLAAKR